MFFALHSTLMGHNVPGVFYVVTIGGGEVIGKDASIARVFWDIPLIKALYSFLQIYLCIF